MGKIFHKGNILPPVKKTVFLQRRGLPICHLQRSLHPKRHINPDTQSSPVLPSQCRLWWISGSSIPFGKLGISHISLAKIWGRGESNQEVRLHNRSKGGERVRKLSLLSGVTGGQEGVVGPSLTAAVSPVSPAQAQGTAQALPVLVTV